MGDTRGERVGILGGTFDPIHIGHLVAARWARHALDLDRVVLMVANEPWQKTPTRRVTPAEDRYAMVVAAADGLEGLEAGRLEIDRGGPSYTVDTVSALKRQSPDAASFLIVGADVALQLPTWHRVDELTGLVTLVVVDRGAVSVAGMLGGWDVEHVEIPSLEISSSELRARLAREIRSTSSFPRRPFVAFSSATYTLKPDEQPGHATPCTELTFGRREGPCRAG